MERQIERELAARKPRHMERQIERRAWWAGNVFHMHHV